MGECCKLGKIWCMKKNISFNWCYEKQLIREEVLQEATSKKNTKLESL